MFLAEIARAGVEDLRYSLMEMWLPSRAAFVFVFVLIPGTSLDCAQQASLVDPNKPPPVVAECCSSEPPAASTAAQASCSTEVPSDDLQGIIGVARGVIFLPNSSYEVIPEGVEYLKYVALVLRRNPGVRLLIVGHESSATTGHGRNLAFMRAQHVQKMLVELGIEPERLSVTDMGDSEPLVDDSREFSWVVNARIEIFIKAQAPPCHSAK